MSLRSSGSNEIPFLMPVCLATAQYFWLLSPLQSKQVKLQPSFPAKCGNFLNAAQKNMHRMSKDLLTQHHNNIEMISPFCQLLLFWKFEVWWLKRKKKPTPPHQTTYPFQSQLERVGGAGRKHLPFIYLFLLIPGRLLALKKVIIILRQFNSVLSLMLRE